MSTLFAFFHHPGFQNTNDAANSNILESPFHDEVATTLNEMNSHVSEEVDESEEVQSVEVESEEVHDDTMQDDEFLMSRYDDLKYSARRLRRYVPESINKVLKS